MHGPRVSDGHAVIYSRSTVAGSSRAAPRWHPCRDNAHGNEHNCGTRERRRIAGLGVTNRAAHKLLVSPSVRPANPVD